MDEVCDTEIVSPAGVVLSMVRKSSTKMSFPCSRNITYWTRRSWRCRRVSLWIGSEVGGRFQSAGRASNFVYSGKRDFGMRVWSHGAVVDGDSIEVGMHCMGRD